MNILALDASVNNTGMVVMNSDSDTISYYNVFTTTKMKRDKKTSQSNFDKDRIDDILCEIVRVSQEYDIDFIVSEQIISGCQDAKAAKCMSLIAGMLYAVSKLYKPVSFFDVRSVKESVTGKRDASKDEVIEAVIKLYPCLSLPMSSKRSKSGYSGEAEHIADAIAVYHAYLKKNNLHRVS